MNNEVDNQKFAGTIFIIMRSIYLIKEKTNAPSTLLSYISTREFYEHKRSAEKHEPKASASRTSRVRDTKKQKQNLKI